MKVCKFGGTSMASADTIRRVGEIVASDPARRFVVVSAPGRRDGDGRKTTDLLYLAQRHAAAGQPYEDELSAVFSRFSEIAAGLGASVDLAREFAAIRAALADGASADYCASRGEYLAAKVLAAYLRRPMIDAAELVSFFANGEFDPEYTNDIAARRLSQCDGAVIPGFYGATPDGAIKTFSRGGSDVTGAVVARAVRASVYENWTDVNGFLTCDPRVVRDPSRMRVVTYRELRELSYMGASVLHPDAIFPVRVANIPINIRNTFDPDDEGTMIVPTERLSAPVRTVTGIAGKKNFAAIHVEKSMMNGELGFIRRALSVLEHYGIRIEHIPSGIDTMTLVIDAAQMDDALTKTVISELKSALGTDHVRIERGIALIATVGHGMTDRVGIAGTLCKALSDAGINIRMIDQGSSELNIIVAVRERDFERAINAIYSAFSAG